MSELERCRDCDEPTGRARKCENSLYCDNGMGPYCEECWGPDRIEELEQAVDRLEAQLVEANQWIERTVERNLAQTQMELSSGWVKCSCGSGHLCASVMRENKEEK